MSLEVKVHSVHYKKINPVCAYTHKDGGCDSPHPTYFSVSIRTDGMIDVRTMCEKHRNLEGEHLVSEGMEFAGPTTIAGALSNGILVDPAVHQEVVESLGFTGSDEEE